MAMPPSSTVHGGQHDTEYVTFESLLHAAFVADDIWGFVLEPARSSFDFERQAAQFGASRRGRKMLNSFRHKNEGMHRRVRGSECLLCDSGSDSRNVGRWSSRAKTMDEMENRMQKSDMPILAHELTLCGGLAVVLMRMYQECIDLAL